MKERNIDWKQCSVDDLCEYMAANPMLCDKCPQEAWGRFLRGHWVKLIIGDRVYSEKFTELGLKEKMIPEWCCPDHWAKAYATVFKVITAAATSEDHRVERIAMHSVLNPHLESESPLPFGEDRARRADWVASIVQDLAEMAQIAAPNDDATRAERYAFIAKAAGYAIRTFD